MESLSNRRLGERLFGVWRRSADWIRKRVLAHRVRPPLYQGSVLDDVIFAQPVNIPLRILRWFARLRPARWGEVTVVIVNFNTLEFMKKVCQAVREMSPEGTEIIVIDNASRDGSWDWLRQRPFGVRAVRVPTNIGHGRALDIGLFLSRSEYVVTLDSDAFPFSSRWIETIIDPLSRPGFLGSGAWGPRGRLHPACSAFRRRTVLDAGLSFQNYNLHRDLGQDPVFGENTWDTGELLFEWLGRDRVVLHDAVPTEWGWGVVIGGVVYHHTGGTTGITDDPEQLLRKKARLWNEAITKLTGD